MSQTTLADETESFATQEAIATTLQRYVDGARNGDTRLLRSAFAPGARVSGPRRVQGQVHRAPHAAGVAIPFSEP